MSGFEAHARNISDDLRAVNSIGLFQVYALLFIAAVVAAFVFGHYAGKPVRVVKVPVKAHLSRSDAVQALGKPDGEVDGAQLNPQLAGTHCSVWQSSSDVIIRCSR